MNKIWVTVSPRIQSKKKSSDLIGSRNLCESLEAFDESGLGVGRKYGHPWSCIPTHLVLLLFSIKGMREGSSTLPGGRAHPIPAEAGESEALALVSMEASSSKDARSSSSSNRFLYPSMS